jgi:NADPH:quinone reductase
MQKVIVGEYGAPEVLKVVTSEAPTLKPGEVMVDVEAAGINYLDVYQRHGYLDTPKPFTPGLEGVGTIREVGAGVSNLKIGGRVAWINVFGSYAGQIALPAEQAIVVPDSFSTEQNMLFQGVTAQYLLNEYRSVRPGDTVLVHAAAGGVGQILVQWLKHLGAIVIGTGSTEQKLRTVRSLGADHTVNYSNGFLQAVLDLTGGRGVDLALDAVGATTFPSTLKALARRGMAVSYGRASGYAPDIEILPLILKGTRVAGASLFEYIDDPAEMQARAADVIRGIQDGWLRVGKMTRFGLDDVVAAHRAIEGRTTEGKLALIPQRQS